VNPASIGSVTALQDTYFRGGTVASLMGTLASAPDSILVSAETVSDYQLVAGDTVKLRLRNAATNQLVTVPFRYVGIVTEFPTEPKDSFFVANADYVAQQTANSTVGAFLIDTGGRDTATVRARIQTLLGPAAKVTDISHPRGRRFQPDRRQPRWAHPHRTGLRTLSRGGGRCAGVRVGFDGEAP
jgi:putative ABC transport system permease protein